MGIRSFLLSEVGFQKESRVVGQLTIDLFLRRRMFSIGRVAITS
jgi:hypothetical protein